MNFNDYDIKQSGLTDCPVEGGEGAKLLSNNEIIMFVDL